MSFLHRSLISIQTQIKSQPHQTQSSISSIFNLLISAHTQSHYPTSALLYAHRMLNLNLAPTSSTLHNLLTLLITSNLLPKAKSLFSLSNEKTAPLDPYSYSIMIKAHCNAGDCNRASKLLLQYENSGGAPNVVMYTSLIDGYFKNQILEEPKRLFSRMGEIGLDPNEFTYTVMINGCFRNGCRDDGLRFYEDMKGNGVVPNLFTYNSIISEYCRASDLATAFKVFDETREGGCVA